ncbi:hypothetical protein K440DRAFT_619592 [Wilcoxina mikolae CBS 423.85]|nr:hypothetical protein K440DRAFT_619592 [Wilcoxina mikolae CBS 423.85]
MWEVLWAFSFLAGDIFVFFLSLALYIYPNHLVSPLLPGCVKPPVGMYWFLVFQPQGVPVLALQFLGLWEDIFALCSVIRFMMGS